MNELTARIVQTLHLPDAAYRGPDDIFDRIAAAMDPSASLSDAPPSPVLALGLPASVQGSTGNEGLPAVVMTRLTMTRLWWGQFQPNFHLLIVDLASGELRTATPLTEDAEFDRSRRGPPPSPAEGSGSLHGFTRFAVAPVFGPTWPSSAYAVTAIYLDWASNTVRVAGQGGPQLDAGRLGQAPSAFVRRSAPTLTGEGLQLAWPEAPPPGTAPVSGRIRATRQHLAVQVTSAGAWVVRLHIVLVALDDDYLRRLEVVVPAELEGDRLTADFVLDLAERPEMASLAGGEFEVYLVSGPNVAHCGLMRVSAV